MLPGNLTEELYRAGSRVIDDLEIVVEPMDADAVEACAMLSARYTISCIDAVFVYRSLITGKPLLTTDARLGRGAEHLVRTVLVIDR